MYGCNIASIIIMSSHCKFQNTKITKLESDKMTQDTAWFKLFGKFTKKSNDHRVLSFVSFLTKNYMRNKSFMAYKHEIGMGQWGQTVFSNLNWEKNKWNQLGWLLSFSANGILIDSLSLT